MDNFFILVHIPHQLPVNFWLIQQ